MARSTRRWDLVLYGASGFVGRQTAAYIARHGAGLRWAVAGRNAGKLREVLAGLGPAAAEAGVIVADAHDAAALDALAAGTRVVLSSAGPYALYGSELVAACVRRRTHYVDITGETPWVRKMIDRHHDAAARDGTRIVPGCGFDSVPSDLGTWLMTRAMRERHGSACVEVKASFSMKGGVNGGTVASLLNNLASGRTDAFLQPFLLNPAGTAPEDTAPHADPYAPHRDDDFDAWLGPFVMGPINTRVVRRSAALARARGDGAAAALAAAGMSAMAVSGQGALALAPMRWLLSKVTPAPGEGPSERAMDEGWFRCRLVARDAEGHVLRGKIADRGDPGNRATTKFVCESALALLHDADALPPGGGVLTPATAFGAVLVRRLREAGMTLTVED